MELEIDPKVDVAFKKVFGSEETALLLIDLLQSVVQPSKPITGLEFGPGHSRKDAPADKQAIGDIRARDQGNRQFHVEMQWQVPWVFPKRVLFYWSKFHPEQLREGEDYHTLRPTISVCFVNQTIFSAGGDHHRVFGLRDKQGLVFSDDIEIHLIELPKFTKTVEEVSSALDRWCYFLRHGAKLDLDHLPGSMDVPEIRRAMEVLTVFTQDEHDRAAYEARLMFQRDQSSILRESREAREGLEAAERALADWKENAEREKEAVVRAMENAEREKEAVVRAMENAEREKEAVVRAMEDAKREKEAAEREKEDAKREKEAAEREKEAAEREKEAAERAREKSAAISQIRLCQLLLKLPQTSEGELNDLSKEDLASLLALLLKPLLTTGG